MLRAAVLDRTQWLVVACWAVSGQESGLVRSMTCAAFPWLWELSRDMPL